MDSSLRRRRIIISLVFLIGMVVLIAVNTPNLTVSAPKQNGSSSLKGSSAVDGLAKLNVKGRAPKTNYARSKFGTDWAVVHGCDTRNIILNRDLSNVVVNEKCDVVSGSLNDPYTGKMIQFIRGSDTSGAIQIDHVVALSNAWQTGAQQLTLVQRIQLANDPLELLAVDGPTNIQKSDGDAATWLPPNKSFRCQYVARQIAVKQKYSLWVTQPEHDAILNILSKCTSQLLPKL